MSTLGGTTVAEALRYGLEAEDLLIIDFHAHLGRWHHYWFPEDGAEHLVARMDEFGIAASVAHHTLGLVGEFGRGNDIIGHAMRTFPGRIEGATMVNPNYSDEMIPELRRCLREYDMRVIKLYPGYHRHRLNDEAYWPVYEFAKDNNLIVVTHCGPKVEYGSAEQLAEMAAKYPDVVLVAYHVASDADAASIYGKIARANPNYYLEICGPMTHNILERLVEVADEDRLLFGSDSLFLALPPQIGRVASCRLTEDQKRKLLGLNAKRLLSRIRQS